ncbi:MAG TPA: glycosyltransferase [Propionibacteriaceae bacterium]
MTDAPSPSPMRWQRNSTEAARRAIRPWLTPSGIVSALLVVVAVAAAWTTLELEASDGGAITLLSVGALTVVLLHVALTARWITVTNLRRQDEFRTRLRRIDYTASSVGKLSPLVRDVHRKIAHIDRGKSGAAARISSPAADLPDVLSRCERPRLADLRVAAILDEFSAKAFEPEWNQTLVTPETWRQELAAGLDLLFVESAWAGNDGAWTYHLVGQSAPRPALVEMIDSFRQHGVPTVFWNKEDPPHFDDFLATAGLFDVVFTTEAAMVPAYRERLGHERIYVLPFAAQPRMHNPGRVGHVRRDSQVAFGGMYFRHKYPERREQMDFLLPAASKFKLDIFARHQDLPNTNYHFPEPYQPFVRGSLPYSKMLAAYHAYKVILNVNSVPGSASMCARRIFEATASGAAVVSPPTPAIDAFFPSGSITQVSDEQEAHEEIRGLLRSPEYRDRRVHLAQREVWAKHTYRHRVHEVLNRAGVATPATREESLSIILPTIRPHLIPGVLETVAAQKKVSPQLLVLAHGFDPDVSFLTARANELGIADLQILKASTSDSLGTCLNQLVAAADGDILTKMDDDDHYAPWYLHDLCKALEYSGADVVGKAASYVYVASRDATILTYAGHEHRDTDFVRGGTLMARRSVFRSHPFLELPVSEDSTFLATVLKSGGRIYGADRFNFVVHRRDSAHHTWKANDAALFASGDMKYVGNGLEQITV